MSWRLRYFSILFPPEEYEEVEQDVGGGMRNEPVTITNTPVMPLAPSTNYRSIRPSLRASTTRTSTTTTVSLDGDHGFHPHQQPIIVLQEAPVIVRPPNQGPQELITRSQRTLNPYNPRHQRIMRRQMTEDDLPSAMGYAIPFLTQERIEGIVMHNAPIPSVSQMTPPGYIPQK